jgi:hypothetical protein
MYFSPGLIIIVIDVDRRFLLPISSRQIIDESISIADIFPPI